MRSPCKIFILFFFLTPMMSNRCVSVVIILLLTSLQLICAGNGPSSHGKKDEVPRNRNHQYSSASSNKYDITGDYLREDDDKKMVSHYELSTYGISNYELSSYGTSNYEMPNYGTSNYEMPNYGASECNTSAYHNTYATEDEELHVNATEDAPAPNPSTNSLDERQRVEEDWHAHAAKCFEDLRPGFLNLNGNDLINAVHEECDKDLHKVHEITMKLLSHPHFQLRDEPEDRQ